MNEFQRHTIRLLTSLLVLLAGCGKTLYEAGGTVSVDGKPVQEGTIMFCPVQPGRPATGVIQDGKFTLSYENPEDGLPAGDYRVVIVADIWKETKTAMQANDEAILKKAGVQDDVSFNANGVLIHVVPPIYNDVKTTPLTQKIEAASGPQNFAIDIPTEKNAP